MICTAPARPAAGRSSSTRRGVAAGLSIPGLLAACGTTDAGRHGRRRRAARGPGGLALARPDNPVTLPIYADNTRDRVGPEAREGPAAALQLGPSTSTPTSSRRSRRSTASRSRSARSRRSTRRSRSSPAATSSSTCSCPTQSFLERLVVGKVLQPLNLSYIPNLAANVWKSLQSPWYDVGCALHGSRTRSTPPGSAGATTSCRASTPSKFANPWRLLGRGAEDLGQGRAARRPARRPRDGAAAQRRHRRQHRRTEAASNAARDALIRN